MEARLCIHQKCALHGYLMIQFREQETLQIGNCNQFDLYKEVAFS